MLNSGFLRLARHDLQLVEHCVLWFGTSSESLHPELQADYSASAQTCSRLEHRPCRNRRSWSARSHLACRCIEAWRSSVLRDLRPCKVPEKGFHTHQTVVKVVDEGSGPAVDAGSQARAGGCRDTCRDSCSSLEMRRPRESRGKNRSSFSRLIAGAVAVVRGPLRAASAVRSSSGILSGSAQEKLAP